MWRPWHEMLPVRGRWRETLHDGAEWPAGDVKGRRPPEDDSSRRGADAEHRTTAAYDHTHRQLVSRWWPHTQRPHASMYATTHIVTLPPIGEQSIVSVYVSVSLSLCVCLCVFVCLRAYLGNTPPIITDFLCMLPKAVLCPPLTSYLRISRGSSTWPPSWWKHSPHAALDLVINGT